jgi:phenylpropionate dioxygenase-like ring-hydroxylating dioxygenase large terminal subunit
MMTAIQEKMQKGHGTEVSPCWRDLAAADSKPNPPTLTEEHMTAMGTERIPAFRYTSYDYHRREVEKIWKRTWQIVCRAEEIPEVGDHFIYNVAGMSFIVVRVANDTFKAYWNVCRHRGRKLVDQSGKCAAHFKCAYHAWTWDIEGKLAWMPGEWDFPDVKRGEGSHDLAEVQVDTWGGFIFINPDNSAAPLSAHLGSMARHFETWPLDDRYTLWHVRKTIRSNWKVALEAFLESYHVVATHPQALPSVGEQGTQYDVWDEGEACFSRTNTPTAIPSVHFKQGTALGAISDVWALLNGLRMDDADQLPDNIRDRASLAQWRRESLQEMTGADYSSLSDALMLDSIQYWLFPNFCPWFGEGLPLSYQFRPDGDSPDTCYMDAWMLVHKPEKGAGPPAPAIIELGPDDPFEPHIGAMGLIFDQDDFNMPMVQEGMKYWPAELVGCTLGRYQESRVRFLHECVERAINK